MKSTALLRHRLSAARVVAAAGMVLVRMVYVEDVLEGGEHARESD